MRAPVERQSALSTIARLGRPRIAWPTWIALLAVACGDLPESLTAEEPDDGHGVPGAMPSAPEQTDGLPGGTTRDAMSTSGEDTDGDAPSPPDMGSSTGETPIDPTDDFEGDSLANWSRVQPSAAEAYVQDGALVIEPAAETVWYGEDTADLVYQLTYGNFMVTTPVDVADGNGSGPLPQYRFAGPMLRDPYGALEDYVFVALGVGATEAMVEAKSTNDSVSDYFGPTWNDTVAELRLCRIGPTITALARVPDADWETIATFERADLPDDLQYGMMAYSNTTAAGDFAARFEAITLFAVSSLADCNGP